MTIAAGLAELRAAPHLEQTCADCGRSGDHGLVLWTQSVAIGKRWAHWQVCSGCFKRRTVDA